MKFEPGLSGLRGLAALGVVIVHLGDLVGPNILWVTAIGNTGVYVFLMLSMYLLLGRLDGNPDLKHYFRRRIVRIWPIYYGCLIAFEILYHIPLVDFVRYLFFVEYYVNPLGYFPAAAFWTLQLEEAMYLFIPLIHKASPQTKAAIGYGFILSTIAFSFFLATLSIYGSIRGRELADAIYAEPPTYLAFYGVGILAYLGTFRKSQRLLALVGLGLIAFFGGFPGLVSQIFPNAYLETTAFSIALLPFFIGFGSILSFPPKWLRWFLLLGEESYALYAIHFALIATYGLAGVVYALVLAFAIEFVVRPREIMRRLGTVYGSPHSGSASSTLVRVSVWNEPWGVSIVASLLGRILRRRASVAPTVAKAPKSAKPDH